MIPGLMRAVLSVIPIAVLVSLPSGAHSSSRPIARNVEQWTAIVSEVLSHPAKAWRADWDFALVEFTVVEQEVGERRGMFPTHTWVTAKDVVVHTGTATPQDERLFVRVYTRDSPSRGLIFGGIDDADLWLEDGDRVLALVARPKPEYVQKFKLQENPEVYHWEIQRVAQIRGEQLQIVTKVEPAPSNGLHRGRVAIPSKMKHVLSERLFSEGDDYRAALDALRGGDRR